MKARMEPEGGVGAPMQLERAVGGCRYLSARKWLHHKAVERFAPDAKG
jgi:hypothetical protein